MQEEPCDRLFKIANLFAEQIRQVSSEDRQALVDSGFKFDMYGLIGGQMFRDAKHVLYLIYPQGNWVEVGQGTVLSGLVRRIVKGAKVLHVEDPASLEKTLAVLSPAARTA